VENRGKFLQQESFRRLATVIHEDTDPCGCSGEESEEDVDEAMSIAASDVLSKIAGSSSATSGKVQITPLVALRTRGKAKALEPLKKQPQVTSKSTPVKPQTIRRGSTLKPKQTSLLDKSRSSSPQTVTQRPAPGPQ